MNIGEVLLHSMWCCTGTGMEHTTRYTEAIYTHDARNIWVHLFLPSKLHLAEKGWTLRQETAFPDEPETKIVIDQAPAKAWGLRIRVPAWASGPVVMKVNGTQAARASRASGYVSIRRVWKTGDVVTVSLPMDLRLYRAPDDPQKVAFSYGPIVLVAAMVKVGVPKPDQAIEPDGLPGAPYPAAPTLVSNGDPLRAIIPVADRKLVFRTVGMGRPGEFELVPFHRLHHPRYSVYFRLRTPAEWSIEDRGFRSRRVFGDGLRGRVLPGHWARHDLHRASPFRWLVHDGDPLR